MRVPALLALLLAAAIAGGTSTEAPATDTSAPSPPSTSAGDDDVSELVLLVSLSRHGSRAPNPSVRQHCPNNAANLHAYAVPPEQLTERGMEQMEAAGRHVREVYVDEKQFLSPSFNGAEHTRFEAYFRADAAPRCGQSAIAFGYGLYPDGTGPAGYAKQPIPVFMQLWENEHDFTANAPCFAVMQTHAAHYAATRGAELLERHGAALKQAAAVCGTEFYRGGADPVLATKDVADMFEFDRDEGLPPTPGLTPALRDELSQLAFQHLLERMYSTPREVTTAIGGFPELLVRTLMGAATPGGGEAATKYYSFHGHRELLHGLGFMLGMKFDFGAGMPAFNGSTALHPGTTLFFELHRAAGGDQHFVKLFVWSPQSARAAVKLERCALACPLGEFAALVESHLAQTGTWEDICDYHPVNVPRRPAMDMRAIVESESRAEEAARQRASEEPSESWPPMPSPTTEELAALSETTTATMALRARPSEQQLHAQYDGGFSAQAAMHWAITVAGFGALGALCASTFQRRRAYLAL